MKQKKQDKKRNMCEKNPTRFYCKEETEQGYDKKLYPKLTLNRLKVMRDFTYIYTHWALN